MHVVFKTHVDRVPMSPSELSSIQWEEDSEMCARETWNLVRRLPQVEEHSIESSCKALLPRNCNEEPTGESEIGAQNLNVPVT